MDGHSFNASFVRIGSEGTSPFLYDAAFRHLLCGLLLVGPACTSARIATPCFHTECVPISRELFALGCQFAVGLLGQLLSLTLLGRGYREEWGMEMLNGRYCTLDVICLHLI